MCYSRQQYLNILLLPQPTACALAEGGSARPAKTTAYEEKEQAGEVFGGMLLEITRLKMRGRSAL